jgi:hypothetical protein
MKTAIEDLLKARELELEVEWSVKAHLAAA